VTVRRWLVAAVLFGVLWVFVRGAQLTAVSLLTTLLVGLAVGFPVAYVFRRLYTEQVDLRQTATGLPYVGLYALDFARDIVVSNFDVAYRVLSPRMPLEPQVILIPLRVQTDAGITTIANSITITPGTLTLDHDVNENALYVHVIDGRDIDKVVDAIRKWEDYALIIFDEEHDPSDPEPEITIHPPDYEAPPEPKRDLSHLEALADADRSGDGIEDTADGSNGGADDGN